MVARDERSARTTADAVLEGRSTQGGKIELSAADASTLKQAGESAILSTLKN